VKTILVLEDEPDFQKLLRIILEDAGYKVIISASAGEGWELLTRERPDMLLLDLNLADGNSLPLCRKIRGEQLLKYLPIIILTVCSRPDDIVLGLQSGADDYMVKPCDPEETVTRIETLFRRMESAPEAEG